MEKYVVGIGEALFDCLPDGRKLGGAPANFAYHVSQFGLNGCAISAIGDDEAANGTVKIKRMADGEEKTVPVKDAVETINEMNL